jgi:hypothetical protein
MSSKNDDLASVLQQFQAGEMSMAECLKAIKPEAQDKPKKRVTFKVTPKGCVGIYGLRRMPIVLYISELEKILEACKSQDFQAFMEAHGGELSRKEDTTAPEP